MHDGSHLRIRKLDRDYDPTVKLNALAALEEAEKGHEVLTGVLYVNTEKPTLHGHAEHDGRAAGDTAASRKPGRPKRRWTR